MIRSRKRNTWTGMPVQLFQSAVPLHEFHVLIKSKIIMLFFAPHKCDINIASTSNAI